MAAPVTSAATFSAGGGGITYASNIFGEWVQVHDNLNATAISSSVLLNPGSYSSTDIHPLIINVGTKLRVMAKFPTATSTVTTQPIVRIYGANQVPDSSGVYPTGTVFWRLDGSTWTATNLTVTMEASSANRQTDGTSAYTTPYSNDGYALLGAKSVLVLHSQATSVASTTLLAQVIN